MVRVGPGGWELEGLSGVGAARHEDPNVVDELVRGVRHPARPTNVSAGQ